MMLGRPFRGVGGVGSASSLEVRTYVLRLDVCAEYLVCLDHLVVDWGGETRFRSCVGNGDEM